MSSAPAASLLAFTIPQFVAAHNVSRSHLYGLLAEGRGPRLMKVGRRTLISTEAAAEWRRRMEQETAEAAQA
jgi:predicted DNA-binding transcriptional regulator AlpA